MDTPTPGSLDLDRVVILGTPSCPLIIRFAASLPRAVPGALTGSPRNIPLALRISFPLGSISITASLAAGSLATFFPMIEQVYANFDAMQQPLSDPAVQQRANAAIQGPPAQRMTGLSDALKYTEFFSARGIPTEKAHACLANDSLAQKIADHAQSYSKDGIDSTPTLIINGEKLGTTDWPDLDKALKNAGVS